jgi:putative transcriptional regulator
VKVGLHPSASLLAAYAGGDLALAPALPVSAHLETCPDCRGRVVAFEEAQGALLASQPPVPIDAGRLDCILEWIDAPVDGAGHRPPPPPAPSLTGGVPLPQAVIDVGFGPRRWLTPNLWAAVVHAARIDDWRIFILHAPARTRIPSHGHVGGELIAVLAGDFSDGDTYGPGDFAENAAGRDHELKVGANGPCTCLIAIQGELRWRGWAKLITPLLGI